MIVVGSVLLLLTVKLKAPDDITAEYPGLLLLSTNALAGTNT